MKRSDMIRIIDDFIYQRTPVTGVESRKLANALLGELEEEGMLPPENWYTDLRYNHEWEEIT